MFDEILSNDQGGNDASVLGALAREVGYRLVQVTDSEAFELQGALSRVWDASVDDFRRGLLLGLRELVAAYTSEVRARAERERAYQHWAAQPTVLTALLRALDEGPARPTDLSDRLGKDKSQISRAARRLESEDLIERLPVTEDGRGAWYCLTPRGVRAASIVRHRGGEGEDAAEEDASVTVVRPAGAEILRAVERSKHVTLTRRRTKLTGAVQITEDDCPLIGAGSAP